MSEVVIAPPGWWVVLIRRDAHLVNMPGTVYDVIAAHPVASWRLTTSGVVEINTVWDVGGKSRRIPDGVDVGMVMACSMKEAGDHLLGMTADPRYQAGSVFPGGRDRS